MTKLPWNYMKEMPATRVFEFYHQVSGTSKGMSAFHGHEYYEIYMFISGSMQIAAEEKQYKPQPYTMFIFPPGVMHRCLADPGTSRYERIFGYTRRDTIAQMSTPDFPMLRIFDHAAAARQYCFHPSPEAAQEFVALADEIIYHAAKDSPADAFINRCRMMMLIAMVCRSMDPEYVEVDARPTRIQDIVGYIGDHITENITLDQLAAHFFISKYHLLRTFKEYTSLSVHQYIISKRVIQAQVFMQNGTPPGQAATQCGFTDYAGFYRAFLKQTDMKPLDYFHVAARGSLINEKTEREGGER